MDVTKDNRPAWIDGAEQFFKMKLEAYYHYYNQQGYAYTKLRFAGKKIRHGHLVDGVMESGKPDERPLKAHNAIYTTAGSIGEFTKAAQAGTPLIFTEGEKDTDRVAKECGFIAFTTGGKDEWNPVIAEMVRGADLIISRDNDEPGEELAAQVARDCFGIARSIRIVNPYPQEAKADASDYFDHGGTKDGFMEMVDSAPPYEPPQEGPAKGKEATAEPSGIADGEGSEMRRLTEKFREMHVEDLSHSDMGNARLFGEIYKDRHRFSTTARDWMQYDGKRWRDDGEGMAVRNNAKTFAKALMRYAVEVDESGAFAKQVAPLSSLRGRENLIKDARDEHFFSGEDFDTQDDLLNVQNGILDLSGDEPKLLEHDPDILVSKICNASFDPSAKAERWGRFIEEITEGDGGKADYLQRVMGLTLTGNTSEKAFFILYGPKTNNAKSTFIETIAFVLGSYATSIRPETLAQKQADSRSASPDIAKLAGARLVNAPEPAKRMIIDASLLKMLTGGVDEVTARRLYQAEFSFRPRAKFFLSTNHLPTITDASIFASDRVRVVPFTRYFRPEERDKHLFKKLQAERDGILLWMIRGLGKYKREGLAPPKAIAEATEQYRRDSDKIGRFLGEVLTRTPGENMAAGGAYEAFSRWCSDGGYGTESKSSFFADLQERGLFAERATVDGKTVKNVLMGYSNIAKFVDAGKTPFDP